MVVREEFLFHMLKGFFKMGCGGEGLERGFNGVDDVVS